MLFSYYERQVQAQFAGQITVAWNSLLAWLQSESIAAAAGKRVQAADPPIWPRFRELCRNYAV